MNNINPSHYRKGKLETIENIKNSMSESEYIGFLKGNIYKYVARYEEKNGIEDLEKAKWYINKLIDAEKEDSQEDTFEYSPLPPCF